MDARFARELKERTARIGVVGLGYVGLPVALAYADAGFTVVGLDVSADRVRALCAGTTYIMDVSAEHVRRHVDGRFLPTTDPERLRDCSVIFICVPTPLDRTKAPDLAHVEAAASTISSILRPGQTVILESTTYPGTTDEVLTPILERSGLKAGVDFFVAHSPERVDPGNGHYTIANTPKVVGGADREGSERAAATLEQVVTAASVHRVSSARVAELTKLLENTFRAVNVGMINELAMLCDRMGIDVWEVITAAKTKPYGFMPFYPGPGVGGHCIPIDPYYLLWKAKEYDFSTKFIEVATAINIEMPFFAVEKLRRILRERGKGLVGAKLLVIGAAFKRDTDDARNSSAVRVIEILTHEGALVRYHDPHVPRVALADVLYGESSGTTDLASVQLTSDALHDADCVVILVGHTKVEMDLIVREAHLVFDAVNATEGRVGPATVVRL